MKQGFASCYSKWDDALVTETKFDNRGEFLLTISEMEKDSRWIVDQENSSFIVSSEDNHLVLQNGENAYRVHPVAFPSLCEAAKLSGSALRKMDVDSLATVFDMAFSVGTGKSLMLLRHGELFSLHGAKYVQLPLLELISVSETSLQDRFGSVSFVEGVHSDVYTSALWTLDGAQAEIEGRYRDILSRAGLPSKEQSFVAQIRFSSSDTSMAAATLDPIFRIGKHVIRLNSGISVRHEGGATPPMERFVEGAKKILGKMDESLENLERLVNTEILNPANCFVGVCNRIKGIPRKIADNILSEIDIIANFRTVTAYDLYLHLSSAVEFAALSGAGRATLIAMEDKISSAASLDWSSFDVGGVVAWGK